MTWKKLPLAKFFEMAKTPVVWITGADGFTGRYLVDALRQKNYTVITTVVDITDPEQVTKTVKSIKPDYIINLAGISFVPEGADASVYAVNTLGPTYILEACLELATPPTKIIFASSANIYGSQQQASIDETCIANPVNHYGCSKWAMEQLAKNYSDRLDILMTRPFNYTGVGQSERFLVPKIIAHIKHKKQSIRLGNIDIWRDFSDVRWVVEAYIRLMEKPDISGVVNLCSGRLTSISDILEHAQKVAGTTISVVADPALMRQTDIARQCGNNHRLFELVPEMPSPPAFEETLNWMMTGSD